MARTHCRSSPNSGHFSCPLPDSICSSVVHSRPSFCVHRREPTAGPAGPSAPLTWELPQLEESSVEEPLLAQPSPSKPAWCNTFTKLRTQLLCCLLVITTSLNQLVRVKSPRSTTIHYHRFPFTNEASLKFAVVSPRPARWPP